MTDLSVNRKQSPSIEDIGWGGHGWAAIKGHLVGFFPKVAASGWQVNTWPLPASYPTTGPLLSKNALSHAVDRHDYAKRYKSRMLLLKIAISETGDAVEKLRLLEYLILFARKGRNQTRYGQSWTAGRHLRSLEAILM